VENISSMLRRWFFSHGISLTSYVGYPLGTAVKLFRYSQGWDARQMADFQRRNLQSLMRHCYDHVPYYADVMRSRNLRPNDFQVAADLAQLPFLTREIIGREGKRLRASNYPDNVCQFRRSGGTTGEPIEVALDVRARAYEVAAFLRGLEWMNYCAGSPMIYLFGGSLGLKAKPQLRDKMREWTLNMRFLPAFELTPENVGDYYEVILHCRAHPGRMAKADWRCVRRTCIFLLRLR
jgi:phenylacetate-CoA ligase